VIYIIFKGEFIYYCELAAFMPYHAAADVNNSPKLALQHASSAASGK